MTNGENTYLDAMFSYTLAAAAALPGIEAKRISRCELPSHATRTLQNIWWVRNLCWKAWPKEGNQAQRQVASECVNGKVDGKVRPGLNTEYSWLR